MLFNHILQVLISRFFYCQITTRDMGVPQFFALFTGQWACGLLLGFAFYDKIAINISIPIFVWSSVSLGSIPRHGIAWLHGVRILNFAQ